MQGGFGNLIFFVLAGAAFWFLVIRPQQARRKEQAAMLASVAPGTEIVTVGGIFATVVSLEDDRLRVRVVDGSELEIAQRAVGQIVPPDDATENSPVAARADELADNASHTESDTDGDV